jgi:hypothetical protein
MYNQIKEGKKLSQTARHPKSQRAHRAFVKREKKGRKRLARVLSSQGLAHLDSKKYLRKNQYLRRIKKQQRSLKISSFKMPKRRRRKRPSVSG